jgi:hypothetical protein
LLPFLHFTLVTPAATPFDTADIDLFSLATFSADAIFADDITLMPPRHYAMPTYIAASFHYADYALRLFITAEFRSVSMLIPLMPPFLRHYITPADASHAFAMPRH